MRTVELFAGAGGAALGLHRAGAEAVALVEWDADAAAVLRAAGAEYGWADAVRVADVREWTASEEAGRLAGTVDLLWASPP